MILNETVLVDPDVTCESAVGVEPPNASVSPCAFTAVTMIQFVAAAIVPPDVAVVGVFGGGGAQRFCAPFRYQTSCPSINDGASLLATFARTSGSNIRP